ncbi:MAG: DUF6268 family outer membrane beta-barrel protein [Bacteroidota bacterium]
MSQDIQLAGFSYTRFPSAEVKDTRLNQELEVNEYNFFLNLPKRLKNEKTVLINGLQYRLVTPFVDNDLNLGLDGQNLHLIGYRFTVVHQLSDSWGAVVSLNPIISSTFNVALEGSDFLLNGTMHFMKKKSDRLSYGGGIALTARFGEPMLIPTLQLNYKTEKDRFRILLPSYITYDRFFGKLTAGLLVAVNGSRYNVNNSRTNPLNEIEFVDMLAYSRVVLGPSLSYRMGKFLRLEALGGMTLARRVEHQSDLLEDQNYDIANGPFFRLGIAIVPPNKDDN